MPAATYEGTFDCMASSQGGVHLGLVVPLLHLKLVTACHCRLRGLL